MYLKTLKLINCFVLIVCDNSFDDNFLEYDFPSFQRTKDIRQSFIKTRKQNNESEQRIQQLDKYLPNITVYVDDIAHYAIDKTNPQWNQVNQIETEFRNVIGMKGLKYTYKRDTFWRTWRKVRYTENDRIICYRCENTVNFTNCHNSGFWVIEEKPPPCPYELFSIISDDKICAVHINQYHDVKNSCTSKISQSDLTRSCNNPIVTEWRIQKLFNSKISERFPYVICGGRESCTISTLYKINAAYISFRIVNATNDIIYSRIMKNNKNYACIKECGKIDSYSKKISKAGKSLLINLLGNKNKREDKNRNKHATKYLNKTKTYMVNKNQNVKNILVKSLMYGDIHPLKLSLVQDAMDD